MIDEEKAKAEEAAQEELEQKLERLEGNLGNIRFVCFFFYPLLYLLRKSGCQFVCYEWVNQDNQKNFVKYTCEENTAFMSCICNLNFSLSLI